MSIKTLMLCAAISMGSSISGSVLAVSLTGEYSVNVTTTQLNVDSYLFQYDVTNNNQGSGATYVGLDGFYIQVPNSATISNVTNPASYSPGGWWSNNINTDSSIIGAPEAPLLAGNSWLVWWGSWPASVYPAGTTASFSFQADGVALGTANSLQVTYWHYETPTSPYWTPTSGANYSTFSTALISPVTTVPLPSALLLFATGIAGMLRLRKKGQVLH